MFRRIWQWLVKLWQRLFAVVNNSNSRTQNIQPDAPPPLTSTDYEYLFMQLLEGVHRGKGDTWAVKYILDLQHRISPAQWVEWLQSFGERLLGGTTPNNELAARLVQLGELIQGTPALRTMGQVAYEIGVQVLTQQTAPGVVWEYNGPDANAINPPPYQELPPPEAITLDELLVRLEQDPNLRQIVAQQMGLDSTDPQLIMQTLVNQFNLSAAGETQSTEVEPDQAQGWFNQGFQQQKLGNLAEAIACYDRAIELKPDYEAAWNNRGSALSDLENLEEAIVCFDRAVAIIHAYDIAWFNRGVALSKLERWEEAIASYDQALEINPNLDAVWNTRGNALRRLERLAEAIASYNRALEINPNLALAWINRGITVGSLTNQDVFLDAPSPLTEQNPNLNQIGNEGSLANYEEGLKYCLLDTNPVGWGRLHLMIGNVYYEKGRLDSDPDQYWQKAIESYHFAQQTLTEIETPELHLELLQNLIRTLLSLGRIAEAQELAQPGSDLLDRLLGESNRSTASQKQLALKFVGFQQLQVDLYIQSGAIEQAWQTAEKGKNSCLTWLLSNWGEDIPQPSSEEIKQLLKPDLAIVYWHISPVALQTFIFKDDAIVPLVLTAISETEIPESVRRLIQFENWINDWDQQYQEYGQSENQVEETKSNWYNNLPELISRLGEILDIARIESVLKDINYLILIPHRDLHRFPLNALFTDKFTVSYLPSLEMGLSLHQEGNIMPNILNIDSNNNNRKTDDQPLTELSGTTVQSEYLSYLFADAKRMTGDQVTEETVVQALLGGYNIFSFIGMTEYNFNQPSQSALVLSAKEHLRVEKIVKMNLKSYQLVYLSIGENAITKNQIIKTEYFGLVSAFLKSGVSHVISSLWTVPSDISALVMMQFFQLWQNKSEELVLNQTVRWLRDITARQLIEWCEEILTKLPEDEEIIRLFIKTQLRGINQIEGTEKPYAHPYYWAGFTIAGKIS